MTPRQLTAAVATVAVVAAALLQGVVLARLPLPGPTPALTLTVVIALGMSLGQTAGAVSGFGAGLLLDLLPPQAGPLGLTAFAFVIVGSLAGRVRDPRGLAPAQLAALLAGLSLVAWCLQAGLAWILGTGVGPLWWSLLYVVWGTLLGMLAVPAVAAVMRRLNQGRRPTRRRARVSR